VPGYLPPATLDSASSSHQRLIEYFQNSEGTHYAKYLKYNCAVVNYHYNWPTNPPENPAFTLPGTRDLNDGAFDSGPYGGINRFKEKDYYDTNNPGGTGANEIIALYNQGTPKALPASLGFRSADSFWSAGYGPG
jgi:hypothetical protein